LKYFSPALTFENGVILTPFLLLLGFLISPDVLAGRAFPQGHSSTKARIGTVDAFSKILYPTLRASALEFIQ
tara:strand:+ start:21437 stop:21652 length:216 start_codon:yes stop_codon:yes gene_type:complete